MPFPSETFIGQFASTLQMVGDELRAYASQVTGWMATEHKANGSHGNVTMSNLTASGAVRFDGADLDKDALDNGESAQVLITRTSGGTSPTLMLESMSGIGGPSLTLLNPDEPTAGTGRPLINIVAGLKGLLLSLSTTDGAGEVDTSGNGCRFTDHIYERGRTVAMGAWTSVPYNSGNFTASAGTWGVDNADQVTYAYTLVGKTMTLTWHIKQTDVSNAATLRIAIPGGFLAARQASSTCRALDNGGAIVASACEVTAGVAYVTLYADVNSNNFSVTSSDNTYVFGTFTFEVQ